MKEKIIYSVIILIVSQSFIFGLVYYFLSLYIYFHSVAFILAMQLWFFFTIFRKENGFDKLMTKVEKIKIKWDSTFLVLSLHIILGYLICFYKK